MPQQHPQAVSTDGLSLPDPATGFARVPDQVAELLGCAPGLVGVLASGSEYVAYSVFDSEDEAKPAAMAAVAAALGVAFDVEDEDAVLRGRC